MDEWFKPMEPVSCPEPFDHPGFVHQVKWDGIRILAEVGPGTVSLHTRRGGYRTDRYPELHLLPQLLKGTAAVLDGEAVVLDEEGRPSFGRILRRDQSRRADAGLRRAYPVQYVVFDLLLLNGTYLLDRSLAERQEILSDVLREQDPVAICQNHPEGVELFSATGRLGLEGIVSKELNGLYHPGRKHPTWRKIKHFRQVHAVVGGVLLRQGRANALLLGLYTEKGLVYVGRAASGLNADQLAALTELARVHQTLQPPFVNPPAIERGLQAVWLAVRPTVLVRYTGWTEQVRLRHPVIEGFSTVPAEECLFP